MRRILIIACCFFSLAGKLPAAEFNHEFSAGSGPLEQLKSRSQDIPLQGKKIRGENGVTKTEDCNAFFYDEQPLVNGRIAVAALDNYRSTISLLGRVDSNFTRYYILTVNQATKKIIFGKFIYGQLPRTQEFSYLGGKELYLVMDFDGKTVTARVNGKFIAELPDDQSIKSGVAAIRCDYWTNVYFKRFSASETIPQEPKVEPTAAMREVKGAELDVQKLRSWDLSRAMQKSNGTRFLVSLNQIWEFQPVAEANTLPGAEQSEWGYFVIPGLWAQGATSNFMHVGNGTAVKEWRGLKITQGGLAAWYRRSFDIPADWKDKKISLVLEDVFGSAEIFLNGKKIGEKTDFYKQQCRIDIGSLLKYGGANRIEIKNVSEGRLSATGLGNIYITTAPAVNFGEVKVTTAIERKNLKLEFIKATATKDATLQAVIRDRKGTELFRAVRSFADKLDFQYMSPILWTPDTPELYDLELTLFDAAGKMTDNTTLRIGFREFKVGGGKFFLNGNPIVLKAETGIVAKGTWWGMTYLNNRAFFEPLFNGYKKLNLNCAYMDGPPSEDVMSLADEMGIMLLVKGRMFSHEQLDSEAEKSLFLLQKDLALMAENPIYFNHPAQIGFLIDVWYGYNAGCTNPNYVGLKQGDPNQNGIPASRNRKLNQVAALYRQYFPGLECFTGGSGAVGNIFGTHIYHTWGAAPFELRNFFEEWARKRELPIFIGETYLPYIGSFYEIENFHGGGNPLVTENAARLFGNAAYRLTTSYSKRPFHEFGADSWFWNTAESKSGGTYGFEPDASMLSVAAYLEQIIPGWRFHQLTGIGAFDYSGDALASQNIDVRLLNFSTDYSDFSYKPEAYDNGNARRPANDPRLVGGDLRPTLLSAPFRRAMATVSAAIFDKGTEPLLLDHSGFSGEKMSKSVMVFNDSPQIVNFVLELELRNAQNRTVPLNSRDVTVVAFNHKLIEFEFTLPQVASREQWILHATLKGASCIKMNFPIQVFAARRPQQTQSKLYLYDPDNALTGKLTQLGYTFEAYDIAKPLPSSGILVVGRKALGKGNIPDWCKAAEAGLNILIMEQTTNASSELIKTRTRNVFINAPAHPAFMGLSNEDFANWRGSSSVADAYERNAAAGINWSDWGAGNMVATLAFRRPQHGNFLSLLVSGFDLFQTPLLEYRTGHGVWVASQLEITERLGNDPAVTLLFDNLISYLDHAGAPNKVLFFGQENGRVFLEKFKVNAESVRELSANVLDNASVLLIAAPNFDELKKYRFELNDFVYHGGKVFYLQLGKEFDPAWLPFTAKLNHQSVRGGAVTGHGDGLWLHGWGANDLYWHDLFTVPVIDNLPSYFDKTSPAVISRGKFCAGEFIFITLTPELFGNTPAAGKTVRTLSALFTSVGVNIANPVHPYQAAGAVEQLDLEEQKWEFATDENNVGKKEEYQNGKGNAHWQKGLIADGIEVRVGQPFENFLLRDYNGCAWYRLSFDAPESLVKAPELYFVAGAIDDMDEVFLNGVKIGSTGKETDKYWIAIRNYRIPPGLLKASGNLLAVRVIDEKGDGGITKGPVKISSEKLIGSKPKWSTPYPEGVSRDYNYKPDIVRMY